MFTIEHFLKRMNSSSTTGTDVIKDNKFTHKYFFEYDMQYQRCHMYKLLTFKKNIHMLHISFHKDSIKEDFIINIVDFNKKRFFEECSFKMRKKDFDEYLNEILQVIGKK